MREEDAPEQYVSMVTLYLPSCREQKLTWGVVGLDGGREDVLHGDGLQRVSVQYVQDAALLQAVKPCG